jgi:vacuolar-type H+-ATPase subunit H
LSIYRVIDKLEAYVRSGTWLPFGLRILSEERLGEFVEKMRSTLPDEVGRAKVISTNKDRVIRDAQEKAQQIVSEAATTQQQMIDETDIVRQARTTAEIVLREAEERARKIRFGADSYAAQVLSDLEGRLGSALGSVKKGQEALV